MIIWEGACGEDGMWDKFREIGGELSMEEFNRRRYGGHWLCCALFLFLIN